MNRVNPERYKDELEDVGKFVTAKWYASYDRLFYRPIESLFDAFRVNLDGTDYSVEFDSSFMDTGRDNDDYIFENSFIRSVQTMMQQAMQQQAMQQQAAMMQQAMLAQQQQQAMMQQAMLAQQQKMAQMQTILNQGKNAVQSPNTAPFGSSQIVQPQGNGISVIFRTSGQNAPQRPPISIQCMPDEKVSTLIERYRNKAGDHDQTKKFIFNAKNLNPELSLSAAGIAHNSNIFVVTTKGVQGAI